MTKVNNCYGCNKKKKLNSRHYCISCWKEHQRLVPLVVKKTFKSLKAIKRYSLQGLNESFTHTR